MNYSIHCRKNFLVFSLYWQKRKVKHIVPRSSSQLAICLHHLNSLCRVHMKESGGEQVKDDKFTCSQRPSDLSKREWKVDHSGAICCFWETQLSHWGKSRELQKPVPIWRGGAFLSTIFCGERGTMLQGPQGHRIFRGKKNIDLWGILSLFCHWWWCPFPISAPLPAVLFFFLSPSSSSTFYGSPNF